MSLGYLASLCLPAQASVCRLENINRVPRDMQSPEAVTACQSFAPALRFSPSHAKASAASPTLTVGSCWPQDRPSVSRDSPTHAGRSLEATFVNGPQREGGREAASGPVGFLTQPQSLTAPPTLGFQYFSDHFFLRLEPEVLLPVTQRPETP